MNSELPQFDIEDDADDTLDDPSLPKITVPIDIRGTFSKWSSKWIKYLVILEMDLHVYGFRNADSFEFYFLGLSAFQPLVLTLWSRWFLVLYLVRVTLAGVLTAREPDDCRKCRTISTYTICTFFSKLETSVRQFSSSRN